MKHYSKPEVTDANNNRGRAFPAVGLALAGGYVIGKAATALGKAFEASFISTNAAIPESVII